MINRVFNKIKKSYCISFAVAGLFATQSKSQTISLLLQFLNDDSKVKSAALQ